MDRELGGELINDYFSGVARLNVDLMIFPSMSHKNQPFGMDIELVLRQNRLSGYVS